VGGAWEYNKNVGVEFHCESKTHRDQLIMRWHWKEETRCLRQAKSPCVRMPCRSGGGDVASARQITCTGLSCHCVHARKHSESDRCGAEI